MKKKIILFFLISIFSFFSFGQAVSTVSEFSVESANKVLDDMHHQLVSQNKNLVFLQQNLNQLQNLNRGADRCVNQGEAQLEEVNSFILLLSKKSAEEKNGSTSDMKYLQDKKNKLQTGVADCRLFILRSSEITRSYNDAIEKLSAGRLFERSPLLWDSVKTERPLATEIFQGLEQEFLMKKLGLIDWSSAELLSLMGAFFISLLVAFLLHKRAQHIIESQAQAGSTALIWQAIIRRYIVWLLPSGFISLTLTVIYWKEYHPVIELVFYGIFCFVLVLALIDALFSPPEPATDALLWQSKNAKILAKRLIILASSSFIIFLAYLLTTIIELPSAFVHLMLSIFVTILGGLLIWVMWIVNRSKALTESMHAARYFVNAILLMLFFAILAAEWLGYANFANYLVIGSANTLLLVFATWFVSRLLFNSLGALNFPEGQLVTSIRYYLGVKAQRRLPELSLLKLGLLLIVLGFSSTVFLRIWQVSNNVVDAWVRGLTIGFVVVKIHLVPLKIALALILFSLIILLGRWVSTHVARHQQFRGVPDTQVAMASIVTYVFFALALLFALLVSGVDFTGLAIVAGALSVGMGLGLQGAVNNFVSGLILLIEKPIKPGDRIVVGDKEGFVKKVSIRSTRITTLNHSDIIFPNADLISKEVTNFTFRDRYWRISCAVGVAYGSDIHLVKKLLLDIGKQHPEVVIEGEPSLLPRVLFRSFGESALQFELWCVVKDVNLKFSVQSDLNFAIDAAFRANKITVAFPQRDLHIKSMPNGIS